MTLIRTRCPFPDVVVVVARRATEAISVTDGEPVPIDEELLALFVEEIRCREIWESICDGLIAEDARRAALMAAKRERDLRMAAAKTKQSDRG